MPTIGGRRGGSVPNGGKSHVRACGHARDMSTRRDRGWEAREAAAQSRRRFGAEVREARLDAGLSQRACAMAAGMSHSQLGRIERAANRTMTIDQATHAAMALGLRLVLRTYPDADPARDAAHLALLARFRARLPREAGWQTEVPMPIPGDRRAWDAVVAMGGRRAGCEAETRLRDVQALGRRLALKLRDGAVDVLILVVSDTASNRRVLRLHRATLHPLLPLDGRSMLAALGSGHLPDENGLVLA